MQNEPVTALFQQEELNTKERILDAAIDLISRKGFDAMSIREIAREVGIRESSIYNHFKSKDEILDTIIDYFIMELSRSDIGEMPLDALLAQYGPEGFMNMGGRAYLESINRPRIIKIWRIISIEIYRNDKVRKFFKTTMVETPVKIWEETFRRMVELGYIVECDTRVLAQEFFYYLVYLLFDYFVISFNDSTYCTFTDKMSNDMSGHIKFIFDKISVKKVP